MTVSSGATANWTGGTLGGGSAGGTLYGTLTVASGSNTLYISGNTLLNAGTLAWTGGAINSAQYGTVVFTNLPSGLINFQADGTPFLVGYSSTATLVNQGTISKSGGGLNPTSVQWPVDFRNGGVINAQVGVLNFDAGGILNNGTTTVTGTAIAALDNGTFTVPSGATFTSASPTGNYLNWTGGTLTGGTTGGALAGTIIVTSGPNTQYVSGNTLFNAGTLAWTSGAITSASSTWRLTGRHSSLATRRRAPW
jgi:hypothetical protein